MKGRRTHLGEIFEPPLKVIWYTIASETYFSQECIPVGCVPSAAVAVSGGMHSSMHWAGVGVYPSMHWAGGVYPSPFRGQNS